MPPKGKSQPTPKGQNPPPKNQIPQKPLPNNPKKNQNQNQNQNQNTNPAYPKPRRNKGCFSCGCCINMTVIVIVVIAVFIALLNGGYFGYGINRYLDNRIIEGSQRHRGMIPFLHQGTPFGFNISSVPEGSLQGKVFVVTGGNVGLGLWTSFHLASKGGNVVMACRSLEKCEEAKKSLQLQLSKIPEPGQLNCSQLDLGSLASIQKFSDAFHQAYNRLDSLILNAGVMACPYSLTKDGIETQIGVNHFGHFYLTQLLLDSLESTATEANPTTVVSVSSAAHYRSYPEGIKLSLKELNDESSYSSVLAYGQSKLANVLFAQELAERVKSKNILVNSIHPGAVTTELVRHMVDTMKSYNIPIHDQPIIEIHEKNFLGFRSCLSNSIIYCDISRTQR